MQCAYFGPRELSRLKLNFQSERDHLASSRSTSPNSIASRRRVLIYIPGTVNGLSSSPILWAAARWATSEEPGRYNQPDPDEYVRIRGEQLKERNGRYELRVTDELEEAMFVDRLQLLVVAHPLGTEVYPNEGMSDPPKASKLFLTHNARPPLSAVDDHGSDVLDRIATLDRRYPDNFKLDRIRGYGAEHSLTLKLAEPASSRNASSRTVLLLTGWTDYAWSSDNVAAAQAGKAMTSPALQVKDEKEAGARSSQTLEYRWAVRKRSRST